MDITAIEDFIWNIRSHLNDPKNSLRKEVHGIVEKCVTEIRALDSRGDDELFSEPLDPKHFEFNQTVHCRLCKVMLPATRCDYMMHKNGQCHQHNLLQIEPIIETNVTDIVENLIEFDRRNATQTITRSDEICVISSDPEHESNGRKRQKTTRWSNAITPVTVTIDPFGEHNRKVAAPSIESSTIVQRQSPDHLRAKLNVANKKNDQFKKKQFVKKISAALKATLKSKYSAINQIKTYLIGAYAYKTATDNINDRKVDILIDFFGSFYAKRTDAELISSMVEVANCLQTDKKWSKPDCIMGNKVLISSLKGMHIECRFHFGNGILVRNTNLLQRIFAAQPMYRELVMSVRIYMDEMIGCADPTNQKFNGYIITLLVLSFLQVRWKTVPSVQSLQIGQPTEFICGTLVSFSQQINLVAPKHNLMFHLLEFFRYYSHFWFDRSIISPFNGHIYNKEDWLPTIPEVELKNWDLKAMCIRDIFETTKNVTAAIETMDVETFQTFCNNAFKKLTAVK